jgi:hypothetical protein
MKNDNLKDRINMLIISEKMQEKPDKGLIQLAQQVLDGTKLTFEDFISTGRFIPKKDVDANKIVFKDNCEHIILYFGGFHIQVLEDRENNKTNFYYQYFDNQESDEMPSFIKSVDLKEVEKIMWSLEVDKYFNL